MVSSINVHIPIKCSIDYVWVGQRTRLLVKMQKINLLNEFHKKKNPCQILIPGNGQLTWIPQFINSKLQNWYLAEPR